MWIRIDPDEGDDGRAPPSSGYRRRELTRAQSKTGPERRREGEGKEMGLANFQKHQTIEFKHRFEFNQTKIVLQHECNNKFLWFIN
jgi:hypothetical protein